MICKNCGKDLKGDEKKCPFCDHDVIFNKENQKSVYNEIDAILIRKYIGPNSDTFLSSGFSLPLFFLLLVFNGFYLLYRKLYFYGFLWILIEAALLLIPGVSKYIILFNLIMAIIFSISIKELYVNLAKEKVNKIKKEHVTSSQDELKRLATFDGGVNPIGKVLMVILAIVYIVLIVYFIYVIFNANGFNNDIDVLLKWR